ncbi:MAG TPA: DUF6491 family protein [Sphingomicrobium sp.]|nr:DUF6491 family protein [Sphingomicrobium sp.]
MRTLAILLAASTISSCMTAPQPTQRSERAEARLQQELAGLSAGQPVSCIANYRADQMIVIDDSTLLFRDGTSRVWRNDTQGSCNLLGAGYTLVLRSSGSALCRGEIGQVTDLRSGTTVGSCVLGDFVPYTRAAR